MSPEYKGTTNENGAEFSYPGGSGCVLIFVGLLGLSILGFVYYRFNGVWPGWDMLEGLDYTLLDVGSLFTIAGLSLYFAGTDDAHTVIFDNTRDTVRIEKKNRSVAIPYQDMVGFSMRSERSSSSSNSMSIYYYVVYWYKKDGSAWDIKTVSTVEKADALIDELSQAIDLQTAGLENITLEVPVPYNMKKQVAERSSGGKINLISTTCFFPHRGRSRHHLLRDPSHDPDRF